MQCIRKRKSREYRLEIFYCYSLESPPSVEYEKERICCISFFFTRSYRGCRFCEQLNELRCFCSHFLYFLLKFLAVLAKFVKCVDGSNNNFRIKNKEELMNDSIPVFWRELLLNYSSKMAADMISLAYII